jgi:ribosomal protein L16 Arg81 hydroxylase
MILEFLLGSVPASSFLEEHFLKLPFALPGGCRELTARDAWQTVERILARPGVDLLAGKEGRPWQGNRPATGAEARALLAAGFTLGIRHAELHDPELAELAEAFRRDFAAPINVHLYCTPTGHPGFGWHYDAEEVFILQTQGSKEWLLRKNTVHPWPLVENLPADIRYEREMMPLLRCTLQAGDWLYIPAGYWHATRAGDESISLSVGILAPTALDVYDFLRRHLVDSLRWRQRLPVLGAASPVGPEKQAERCRELFRELGQDLAELMSQPEVVRDFLKEKGCAAR